MTWRFSGTCQVMLQMSYSIAAALSPATRSTRIIRWNNAEWSNADPILKNEPSDDGVVGRAIRPCCNCGSRFLESRVGVAAGIILEICFNNLLQRMDSAEQLQLLPRNSTLPVRARGTHLSFRHVLPFCGVDLAVRVSVAPAKAGSSYRRKSDNKTPFGNRRVRNCGAAASPELGFRRSHSPADASAPSLPVA